MPCPNTEYQTLTINCAYLVSASSHSAHPENGSLAVFAMCWRPKFREEVRCAKTVSENSGCAKPCLPELFQFLFAYEKNNKTSVHAVRCTAPRHETENISILPGLFRCLFVFWLRYAPIHTDGSHRESRLGGSEWSLSILCALQVSHADSSGQEGCCNVDTMTDGPHKAGAHRSAEK